MKAPKHKTGSQVSLRQKVYEQIKHEIITGRLAPAEPLSEGQFVDRFQVSKTPIREALTSLQKDHLVEYTTNRGFMVAPISIKDIREIFEAREFYEITIFRLVLKNISDEDIEALKDGSTDEVDPDDPATIEAFMQANLDFHLKLARIADNSRLLWHYSSLMDEAQRLIYLDYSYPGKWHHGHEDMIEALRDRDEAAGVKAIREGLAKARKRILGTGAEGV